VYPFAVHVQREITVIVVAEMIQFRIHGAEKFRVFHYNE